MAATFSFELTIPDGHPLIGAYRVTVNLDANAEIETWSISVADGSDVIEAHAEPLTNIMREHVYTRVSSLTLPAHGQL